MASTYTEVISVAKAKKVVVSADMLIGDVAAKYPETVDIMMRWGMHCIGCSVAAMETLGQGATAHGLNKTQIKKMLAEMNSVVARRKR